MANAEPLESEAIPIAATAIPANIESLCISSILPKMLEAQLANGHPTGSREELSTTAFRAAPEPDGNPSGWLQAPFFHFGALTSGAPEMVVWRLGRREMQLAYAGSFTLTRASETLRHHYDSKYLAGFAGKPGQFGQEVPDLRQLLRLEGQGADHADGGDADPHRHQAIDHALAQPLRQARREALADQLLDEAIGQHQPAGDGEMGQHRAGQTPEAEEA